MAIDLDIAVQRLAKRKAELEEFSKLSGESRSVVVLDQQAVGRLSRMDLMQRQALAEAQERHRRHDLLRIEMAGRRIKDGNYGHCIECDEEIPDGRLEIDPMAEKCVRCAL